jgi:predicted porin
MEVGNWQATGATAGAASDLRDRTRVADVGSRVILSVNEDLGGGLRAFVMCETGINIDNGSSTGQANTNNANTTTWCSREGHAGIGNRTAEVRLGRQNVWWTQGPINVTGARWHAGDAVTDLITGGIGQYTVRGENMIMLVAGPGTGAWAGSNVYMGFMGASGHVIPGITSAATTGISAGQDQGESVGANTSAKGKYQGLKIAYSQGALVGSFDMQTSSTGPMTAATQASAAALTAAAANPIATGPLVATLGTNTNLERSAWKLGAGYRYSGTKSPNIVSIQYVDRERTITPGTGSAVKAKENLIALVGQYDMGKGWIINGTYGKTSDRKDNNVTAADTGATSYGLGVVKTLSNRTHALFHYRTINNEKNASYGFAGGNYAGGGGATGAPIGASSKAWGLGLVHLF